MEKIHLALRRGTERSGSSVPPILNRMDTKEAPPTFNRTNKFTAGFQNIVDAYGVANYREMNPAPYTIITFPFLFAVMFGDCGHGFIMFLFALWMVLCEKALIAKKIDDEIWNTFFGGRYIILLMGAWSMYTGLIYNDMFSKSLNIFNSAWEMPSDLQNPNQLVTSKTFQVQPNAKGTVQVFDTPYPFGIDPIWQIAGNKLNFLNSYKMKLSVIFGVIQMSFGVVLSLRNHLNKNDRLSVLTEFVPQIVFMMCLFGYLVLLIFYKWTSYDVTQSGCAPSLLITLINMCLMKYPDEDTATCSTRTFYGGQKVFQYLLLFIALACVPCMLFVKPYLLLQEQKKKLQSLTFHMNSAPVDGGESGVPEQDSNPHPSQEVEGHGGAGGEEFDLQEMMVHQAIHTIEYCLGCISNTASYLRLWALSLAHAQLSEVLWTMVMQIAFRFDSVLGGGIMAYIVFAAWATLTIGVLLIMEGLSAFLHALRLHWVEFQNKFYGGTGYLFMPFSFDTILEQQAVGEE